MRDVSYSAAAKRILFRVKLVLCKLLGSSSSEAGKGAMVMCRPTGRDFMKTNRRSFGRRGRTRCGTGPDRHDHGASENNVQGLAELGRHDMP